MHNIINDEFITKMFWLDNDVQGHDRDAVKEDLHRYERRRLITQYTNKFNGKSYNEADIDNDVYEYVVNRFNDSKSFNESLFRILKHNDKRPVCLTCGGEVSFEGLGYGFKDTCCPECRNKLRSERMQIHEKKDKHLSNIIDVSR